MAVTARRLETAPKKVRPIDVMVGIVEILLSWEAIRLYLAFVVGFAFAFVAYLGLAQTFGVLDPQYATHLQNVFCPIAASVGAGIFLMLSAGNRKTKPLSKEEKRKRIEDPRWV
ncbi:MAG: hypothetical protein IAE91_09845 [Ignavibacteriaceae bacterium]|nr:hypothetical protein [Ignavibacteriaceae bacterium]